MNHRKRILVIEALDNNRGNKQMAMRTIECLSKVADVTVAALSGWFPILPETVQVEVYSVVDQYKIPQISSLIRSTKHLKIAKKLDHINHYDYILFMSYHTVAFFWAKLWFREFRSRVYITHHVNIDDLNRSKIKDFFFKRYARQVNHFVFEPFIKEYLFEKYKINHQKIFILPHPQNKYEYRGEGEKYDCLGISSSNSEEWIRRIIDKEKSEHIFKREKITILLRSKLNEFDDGYLKVIKAHFTDEEYYGLYISAASIVLPFPSTFKYRMSGSIIDALSNRKRVLLSDIPLFRDYESRYPNVCRVGIVPDQLIEFIKQIKGEEETLLQKDDWDKFSSDHSNRNIILSLCKAFKMEVEEQ